MKIYVLAVLTVVCFSLNACAKTAQNEAVSVANANVSAAKIETKETIEKSENAALSENAKTSEAQTKSPKTVRDFFNLLPQKYFLLEGCEPSTDKNCDKARKEYVKSYLETEDTANGYWKSGCDGAQSCLEMAIFKRPDNSYVVALMTTAEVQEDNYFLEYKNGNWSDISAAVVPEFSRKNYYVLPRKGTTVEVYAQKLIEKGDDYEVTERGAKLYDLIWKDGKFQRQK